MARNGLLSELPVVCYRPFPMREGQYVFKIDYLLCVSDTLGGTLAMKKLLGSCFGDLFPLTLQLLAFEAIPQLLNMVLGDDSVTPHNTLPQHCGLTVDDVQKAEHDPQGKIHSTGDLNLTTVGLTDELVDIFRKQYAMDIYKDVVVPLYSK